MNICFLKEKPAKALVELNLPPAVVACYQRSGISHLFAWQAECLEKASASGELILYFVKKILIYL